MVLVAVEVMSADHGQHRVHKHVDHLQHDAVGDPRDQSKSLLDKELGKRLSRCLLILRLLLS